VGPEAREAAEAFKKVLEKRGLTVHLLSGATGEGMDKVLDATVLALDRAKTAGPLDRDVVAIEGALTEEDLAESASESAGVDGGREGVGDRGGGRDGDGDSVGEGGRDGARRPPGKMRINPLAEDDFGDEHVDERALASQEKESRRPALTGRRKDGLFKETAAQTGQVLGKKFVPTSTSAAKLMAKANKERDKEITRALAKEEKRPMAAVRKRRSGTRSSRRRCSRSRRRRSPRRPDRRRRRRSRRTPRLRRRWRRRL